MSLKNTARKTLRGGGKHPPCGLGLRFRGQQRNRGMDPIVLKFREYPPGFTMAKMKLCQCKRNLSKAFCEPNENTS